MAVFSLFSLLYPCIASLLFLASDAATVTYNFTAGWLTANPDGLFDRPVIGINGQWPVPMINVTMGDRIIVNLHNDLGNQSTSLHLHGIFQNGTTEMDGPVGINQCGVPPGASFLYNFTIDQPGTYWYHSHERGQYPDGFRGPVYVNDPNSPYLGQYDEEVMMSVSDWYHEQMATLIPRFINVANPTGAEPIPNSVLMNDSQNVTFSVQAGKTYLFHIVNMGAFAGQYLWFEDHTMEIVEVDGVWTDRASASMIYLGAAQRYSVLVRAKDNTSQNFAIVSTMDQTLFDYVPASLNPNATGYLVYDSSAPMPVPTVLDSFQPFDDTTLVPYDRELLFQDPSQTIELKLMMSNLGNGANYAFFNGVTYVRPKVPTLYSVLSTGASANNVEIYGKNTNAFVLAHNEVVELVLNNDDSGKHPFHLHGHTFQVLVRTDENAGCYDPMNHTAFPAIPMRRDTLVVQPQGHFVIRFRSDNPGVWLFHCHIEWHVDAGLIATIIEAPLTLQSQLSLDTLPASHLQTCKDVDMPYQGNAAGNTEDFTDLRGENGPPAPPLPAGFEARGIVALTFSALSACMGMALIAWYGAKPLTSEQEKREEDKVAGFAVGASMGAF